MFNKEELLKRTNNGLDVFKFYIPGAWRIGRNFLNPFYDDHKASCNIFYDRKNVCYRIKDFGNDNFSGDCFFFVGKIKNLDCEDSKEFVKILQIINRDLNLGLSESGAAYYSASCEICSEAGTSRGTKKSKTLQCHSTKFFR